MLDLEETFTNEFAKIPYEFPPNNYVDLAETYYYGCLEYLEDPDLVDLVDYNVLETELEIDIDIGGYKFIGFIDLVLEHKATGNLVIADYKSKAKFNSTEERDDYARQLYIYAKGVFEKYGKYPTMLVFIHFRKQKQTKIRFDKEVYDKTLEWAVETIEQIKLVDEFPVKKERVPFFTRYMCSHRNNPNHRQGYVVKL